MFALITIDFIGEIADFDQKGVALDGLCSTNSTCPSSTIAGTDLYQGSSSLFGRRRAAAFRLGRHPSPQPA